MKTALLFVVVFVLTLSGFSTSAQTFVITGEITHDIKVDLSDIQRYKTHDIGTVTITNHKGEVKGDAHNMKGFLLMDVLNQAQLKEDNPKLFSEFYFVCEAADGYKVVYSWNELFNTKIAENVFLVTEKDGRNMRQDKDSVLMISTGDLRTGRRFVKNLVKIIVRRAA